jgi:hypothetical protein
MRSDGKPEGYSSVSVYMVAEGRAAGDRFPEAEVQRRGPSTFRHAGQQDHTRGSAHRGYGCNDCGCERKVSSVSGVAACLCSGRGCGVQEGVGYWGRFGAATRAQRRRSGSSRWCQRSLRKIPGGFRRRVDRRERACSLLAGKVFEALRAFRDAFRNVDSGIELTRLFPEWLRSFRFSRLFFQDGHRT